MLLLFIIENHRQGSEPVNFLVTTFRHFAKSFVLRRIFCHIHRFLKKIAKKEKKRFLKNHHNCLQGTLRFSTFIF